MMNTSTLTLVELVSQLDDLCCLIPSNHTAVLIHQPSGDITITRSALDILESVDLSDRPLCKLVINAMRDLRDRLGHGEDRFLFLLVQFLRKLSLHHDGGRQSLLRGLHQIQVDIIPSLLPLILQYSNVVPHRDIIHSDEFIKISELIFKSCLNQVFSKFISRTLCDLLSAFIGSMSAERQLSCVVNEFTRYCMEVHNRPVRESQVIEGCLVTRDITLNSELFTNMSCVLWRCDLSESEPVHFRIDSPGNWTDFSRSYYMTFDDVLLFYKKTSINVIISRYGLPDLLMFTCRRNRISVITHVDEEELSMLEKIHQIKVISDYHELPTQEHIFHVKSICPIILGIHRYTNFITYKKICQIIICAPTAALCRQFSHGCHSALRVLCSLFRCREIPGFSENVFCSLHQPIDKAKFDTHQNPEKYALVTEHTTNKDRLSCNCDVISYLPGDSFFEFVLSFLLQQRLGSLDLIDDSRFVLQSLSEALRAAIHQKFNQNSTSFLTLCEEIFSELREGSWSSRWQSAPITPLYTELSRLSVVLDVTAQLVRIEQICHVTGKLCETTNQSSDSE